MSQISFPEKITSLTTNWLTQALATEGWKLSKAIDQVIDEAKTVNA